MRYTIPRRGQADLEFDLRYDAFDTLNRFLTSTYERTGKKPKALLLGYGWYYSLLEEIRQSSTDYVWGVDRLSLVTPVGPVRLFYEETSAWNKVVLYSDRLPEPRKETEKEKLQKEMAKLQLQVGEVQRRIDALD